MLTNDFFSIGPVRCLCFCLRSLYERLVVLAAQDFFCLIRPAFTVAVTVLALEPADTLLRFARGHEDSAVVNLFSASAGRQTSQYNEYEKIVKIANATEFHNLPLFV
jgi:hypothetical protein